MNEIKNDNPIRIEPIELPTEVLKINNENDEKVDSISNPIISSSVDAKVRLSLKRKVSVLEEGSTEGIGKTKKPKINLSIPESEKILLKETIELLKGETHGIFLKFARILEEALNKDNAEWRDCQDESGWNILHILSFTKHWKSLSSDQLEENLKKFVSSNNINQQNNEGNTPLHHAFRNLTMMEALIQNGADLSIRDNKGRTFFFNIMRAKFNEDAIALMKKHESLVTVAPLLGHPLSNYELQLCNLPPIFMASRINNHLIFKHLSALDICLNQEVNGKTVLMEAIDRFHAKKGVRLEDIQILIARGAGFGKGDLSKEYFRYLWCSYPFSIINALIERKIDAEFSFQEGDASILLLSNKSLTPSEIKELQEKLIRRGDSSNLSEKISLRKSLAHIWGIGQRSAELFFSLNNVEHSYEGTFFQQASEKMSQAFIGYLPTLEKKYPVYFNSLVSELIVLANQRMPLYSFARGVSSEEILSDSKKFPVILPITGDSHGVAVIIYKNRLVKCNRGEGRTSNAIEIYNLEKELTLDIIKKLRTCEKLDYFTDTLNTDLGIDKPAYTINQKDQNVGNCGWASLKAAECALLFVVGLEHSNNTIPKDLLEITNENYKSFTSFVRQEELETYFKSVRGKPEEIDWLLLSRIRIQLDRKLATGKYIGMQKENFEKALNHFETYLTPEICELTEENKDAIVHYFIAIGDRADIEQAYSKGLKSDSSHGGATPMSTAIEKNDRDLIEFTKIIMAAESEEESDEEELEVIDESDEEITF